MHDNLNRNPGGPGSALIRLADAKPALRIALITDDPVTARALLIACEQMPSFDCRVRIGALHDDSGVVARDGEIAVYDTANAQDRRFDAARHPETACVALAHDLSEMDGVEACTTLLFADLSPTTLETAVRSAMRARDAISDMRKASIEFERRFLEARENSSRLLEDVAPSVGALDGLLKLMSAATPGWPAGEGSRFALIRNWTRDLAEAVDRHRQALASEYGARADLVAIVEKTLPRFEKKCAARRQTLVFSAPPAPLVAAIAPDGVNDAFRALMQSIVDREGGDRRIDVLLWRSLDECRLAIVAGPSTRRRDEAAQEQAQPPHAAPDAEAAFSSAIQGFQALGATVNIVAKCAVGSTIMVALPAAG